MRYGIVSDIHGNLEALSAVLEAIGAVDEILCPGDIVGYGPNPNECCEIISDLKAISVLGNHDAACVGLHNLEWFNPHAQTAILWTRDRLAKSHADRLLEHLEIHSGPEFLIVHGSLTQPLEFDYITSPWRAGESFAEMGKHAICFIGHTHIAEVYAHKLHHLGVDQIPMCEGGKITLAPSFKYIVNCGSVGQPRDGNPLASYGIYDSEENTIEICRVEYDMPTAQRKMIEAGLPDALWQRLEYGM